MFNNKIMLKSSLFLLIFLCFIQTPIFSFEKNNILLTGKFDKKFYHQLKLIFKEEEKGKILSEVQKMDGFKSMLFNTYENLIHIKALHNSNFFSLENSISIQEKIEYKVSLNEIFKEEEFERLKLRLKQDNAPFEIIGVDYKAKTVHIKMQSKILYDQIEKVFGTLRLNVIKIEAIS